MLKDLQWVLQGSGSRAWPGAPETALCPWWGLKCTNTSRFLKQRITLTKIKTKEDNKVIDKISFAEAKEPAVCRRKTGKQLGGPPPRAPSTAQASFRRVMDGWWLHHTVGARPEPCFLGTLRPELLRDGPMPGTRGALGGPRHAGLRRPPGPPFQESLLWLGQACPAGPQPLGLVSLELLGCSQSGKEAESFNP